MNKLQELKNLKQIVSNCKGCKLSTTRTQTVFGEGNPDAELMFIGEGPGRQEDLTGRPFVGKAGELLTRLIEMLMGVPRANVFIANITKCRPTIDLKFEKDRPPDPEETKACSPYLLKQIEIIQPKVIVTLGNPSTKFLLQTEEGITKLRGKWFEYKGIPVMPTYHPSYVLRNGLDQDKLVRKQVWADLQLVMGKLGWEVKKQINFH